MQISFAFVLVSSCIFKLLVSSLTKSGCGSHWKSEVLVCISTLLISRRLIILGKDVVLPYLGKKAHFWVYKRSRKASASFKVVQVSLKTSCVCVPEFAVFISFHSHCKNFWSQVLTYIGGSGKSKSTWNTQSGLRSLLCRGVRLWSNFWVGKVLSVHENLKLPNCLWAEGVCLWSTLQVALLICPCLWFYLCYYWCLFFL